MHTCLSQAHEAGSGPPLHMALRSEMTQTPNSSETQFLQSVALRPHAGGRESVHLVASERRGSLWFCRPVGAHGRPCPSMSLTDGYQALTSNQGGTAVTSSPCLSEPMVPSESLTVPGPGDGIGDG